MWEKRAIFVKSFAFSVAGLITLFCNGEESPLRWRPLLEPGCGGAIVALRISPHDSKHLISSGDMLGAAVSFDGGDSWQPTYGFPAYEMCDITFHPINSTVI